MAMVSWFTIGVAQIKEAKRMLGFKKEQKEKTKEESPRVEGE